MTSKSPVLNKDGVLLFAPGPYPRPPKGGGRSFMDIGYRR